MSERGNGLKSLTELDHARGALNAAFESRYNEYVEMERRLQGDDPVEETELHEERIELVVPESEQKTMPVNVHKYLDMLCQGEGPKKLKAVQLIRRESEQIELNLTIGHESPVLDSASYTIKQRDTGDYDLITQLHGQTLGHYIRLNPAFVEDMAGLVLTLPLSAPAQSPALA